MAFESSLEVSRFEFPNFDGAIFRGGGDLGIAGVEGQRGDVEFVAFELEFGRGFGEE